MTDEAIYFGGVTALDVRNAPIEETTRPPKNAKPYKPKEADRRAEESRKKAKNPRYWEASVPNYWSMTFSKPSTRRTRQFKTLWSASFGKGVTVRIKAGNRLYGAGPNVVAAMDLPAGGSRGKVTWRADINGTPASLLAADDRLFVVTREGAIYCFGADKRDAPRTHAPPAPSPRPDRDEWSARATSITGRTGVREGYCLVLGVGSGRLAEELVRQTKLRVIAVDEDAKKIDSLRSRWDAAGLYGSRLSAFAGDPLDSGLPPYLANLIVSEDIRSAGLASGAKFAEKVFFSLRPYGGVACLPARAKDHAAFVEAVKRAGLAGADVRRLDGFTLLSRCGALPGSDAWSHEYANAAETQASRDDLVKAPLGVLWFGGPSSRQAIAHKKSANPIPRVAGGRMYVEGDNMLHAFDAYSGRMLWRADFPGRGQSAKTHLVVTRDVVYLVDRQKLLALDARTGKPLPGFRFAEVGRWGALKVWKDYLIAPVDDHLTVADRHNGKVHWRRESGAVSAVVVGKGTVFCADSSLSALAIADGEEIWSKPLRAGQLAYGEAADVLIVNESAALRGKDGKPLWGTLSSRSRGGRYRSVLLKDMILTNSQRRKLFAPIDVRTGETVMQEDPWTGKLHALNFSRSHGCGGVLGSEHLLMFRSSTAALLDLDSRSGTSNFGGFRSGCVPNLVAADGLLNAPTNLKGCTCNFPIRASVAMIHMPDLEIWSSYSPYGWLDDRDTTAPPRRVGLNFGAPGDRRISGGTLWVDYPSVGGPSPEVKVRTAPELPRTFRYHSMRVRGEGLKWVAASGLKGLESMTITLDESPRAQRRFTVRLHFAEPDDVQAGERVFDVLLQGKTVLKAFDIAARAGGRRRPVVKEFTRVAVEGDLKLQLKPAASAKVAATIICGIEIVAEDQARAPE